ncbi:hypothetical protein PtA15_11A484 [Puccinia triticina]|uniref:Uncharacterized protein n=1 Tax=Puccinia triticina TaxID=208348 RepID=A0ABY7CY12_9BASI|nr:uncharacterized protein PtA15_11A484 [Puccinia triticina]WAQ89793.1 hypothetical protein PtA15_11A484 [Puccinia triticina]WAR59837.1 hypothetical protein PtB15_11B478 [Puccinia triticina]
MKQMSKEERRAIQDKQRANMAMSYTNSSIIQEVLLQAHQEGVKFSVALVDSRPA